MSSKILLLIFSLMAAAAGIAKTTISRIPVLPPDKETTVSFSLEDWRYPVSQISRLEGEVLYLKSNDDVGKITEWYRQRIKTLKMTVNNFVQTNTNGRIINQLMGADEKRRVKVAIDRPFAGETEIIVSFNQK